MFTSNCLSKIIIYVIPSQSLVNTYQDTAKMFAFMEGLHVCYKTKGSR